MKTRWMYVKQIQLSNGFRWLYRITISLSPWSFNCPDPTISRNFKHKYNKNLRFKKSSYTQGAEKEQVSFHYLMFGRFFNLILWFVFRGNENKKINCPPQTIFPYDSQCHAFLSHRKLCSVVKEDAKIHL